MSPAPEPPLALDRYAALHAAMEAGEARDTVLTREAVEDETWNAAHAYWLKRMADEAERKRFDTTIRYQTVFSVKRRQAEGRLAKERAARERPPVFGAGAMAAMQRELAAPIAAGPVGVSAAPAPPPIERSSAAARPQAVPSFLQPGAGPAPAPRAVAAPPPLAAPAPIPAPRIAEAGPPPAPAMVAQPARRVYATMSIDARELEKGSSAATPFTKSPSTPNAAPQGGPVVASPMSGAPAPVAPAPVAAPHAASGAPANAARPKQNLGQTMMPSMDPPTAKATPFAGEGTSRPGTTAPPVSRPPSGGHLPFRDEPSSHGLPFRDEPSSHGLPFRDEPSTDGPLRVAPPPSPSATGTAPLPDDARDFARQMLERPKKDDLGSTSAISPEHVRAAVASLPFGGRAPSSPSFPAVQPAPVARPAEETSSPKTQAFDFNSIPAHLREALPFGGPLAPPPAPPPPEPPKPAKKRFSINVFASLTAELAEAPHDAEAIRARYGITESDHHEESRAWTTDFTASDDLRQRYLGIVQRYRGYIQQRKR